MDRKLVDIGVAPSTEVGMAEYDSYLMNGLMTQLTRLKPGEQIEEAHMRNRQMNARWAYEKGKKDNVVEFVKKDGKTVAKKKTVVIGQFYGDKMEIKSGLQAGDVVVTDGFQSLYEGQAITTDAK